MENLKKMSNKEALANIKLEKLLRKKMRIQDVEEELRNYQKVSEEYKKKVRQTAQKLYEMRENLFHLI